MKTNNADMGQTTKKKATNRDVAKLAGVSVATVSYVINGREDQHISEETKKKVYHAINFLNYMPNPHAVGLNTPQPQTIILRSSANVSSLMENEILCFMRSINPICQKEGFQLSYSMDKRSEKIAVNACVCFDMTNEEFHSLSSENFIPVIAVNCLIYDPVFYQITIDYSKVAAAADAHFDNDEYIYCCLEPTNSQIKQEIIESFKNYCFLNSVEDIRRCMANYKNIAVSQSSLNDIFIHGGKTDVYFYSEHVEPLANATFDCICKAINRQNVSDNEHYIKV